MTWNEMKDLWRHVTRRAKSWWDTHYGDGGSLSVRRRQLIGLLNARYGVPKNETAKQIDGLAAKLSIKTTKSEHEKVDNVS